MSEFGARLNRQHGCRWTVWAPFANTVELLLFDSEASVHALKADRVVPMFAGMAGRFGCELTGIAEGQRYMYRLNGGRPRPDPASRWQPDGVHLPSAVWSAETFEWSDHAWAGHQQADLVIYELHVGTLTAAGTLDALIPRLPDLRELGVTAIELLPVGQFPGEFGWGYDGTYWFAVQHSYGGPRALQRLVDACHAAGLSVILDVIYNHLGPEGNYLAEFGPYFQHENGTPWGPAVNYDRDGSDGVREFVLQNVRQWIRDFHVDGLRLDAIQEIYDSSPTHILAQIAQTAEAESNSLGRPIHVIGETNQNDVRLTAPRTAGGYQLSATWNDEFHHTVHVLLTGEQNGYYADYADPPRQLHQVLNEVYVHNGSYCPSRGRLHGTSAAGVPSDQFVVSIQTHDQVGNRAQGDRLHAMTSPEQQRLAAGLLLISPFLPMLFMGEEYGEQRPFPFFCDFGDPDLRAAVNRGRQAEFAAFGWGDNLPDPCSRQTFEAAKLTWSWPAGSAAARLRQLYRDLLTIRRLHPAMTDGKIRRATWIYEETASPLLCVERRSEVAKSSPLFAVFHLHGDGLELCPQDVPHLPPLRFRSGTAGGRAESRVDAASAWQPYEFCLYSDVWEGLPDPLKSERPSVPSTESTPPV